MARTRSYLKTSKKRPTSIYFFFQIVLAACSNFFANIFSANNGEKLQQSLIVLEDIRALDFKHLLQFMYHGQVDIDRFGNMGCQVSKRGIQNYHVAQQ